MLISRTSLWEPMIEDCFTLRGRQHCWHWLSKSFMSLKGNLNLLYSCVNRSRPSSLQLIHIDSSSHRLLGCGDGLFDCVYIVQMDEDWKLKSVGHRALLFCLCLKRHGNPGWNEKEFYWAQTVQPFRCWVQDLNGQSGRFVDCLQTVGTAVNHSTMAKFMSGREKSCLLMPEPLFPVKMFRSINKKSFCLNFTSREISK